jgi:5,10-methylenetetrahydrofolate reductase
LAPSLLKLKEGDGRFTLADKVSRHKMAGVEAACQQIARLRDSGAFDGVHLVPVNRYREVSARLEALA